MVYLQNIQPMSMVLPGVVGFKLTGKLRDGVTATDLVLTVTQMLRKHGVVGKFVEFYGKYINWVTAEIEFSRVLEIYFNFMYNSWHIFMCTGEGMGQLPLADRATIANMSPEYGATMGFFPVDHVTLQYLKLTGRSDETVSYFLFISFYIFLWAGAKVIYTTIIVREIV